MFAFMLQEAENKKRNERYMISTRMEHGQVWEIISLLLEVTSDR